MTKELVVYKIRRKEDGLFSTGGSSPGWTKHGKIWKWAHLRQHFACVREYRKVYNYETNKYDVLPFPYNDQEHEVVVFRQVEGETLTISGVKGGSK